MWLLLMKASDRGRNVKSKQLFGCFDEILLVDTQADHSRRLSSAEERFQ